MGKRDMKTAGFSLFWTAIKAAGVGAARCCRYQRAHANPLGHLQASTATGPAPERLRCLTERPSASACKADYKVNDRPGPEQSLHCASDSYNALSSE